jgi:transcriptional regulator with XRE-family HTH domain
MMCRLRKEPKGGAALSDQARVKFGKAVIETRRQRGLSQVQLAELAGVSQSTVSVWEQGVAEPPPAVVFALEEVVGVAPGHLSRHLGYVPAPPDGTSLEDSPPPGGVPTAVNADPKLDDRQRRALLLAYREFTRSRPQSRPSR